MRQARIKLDAKLDEAAYHCMSRTVNGERLFDAPAREILRRQLWVVAEYCGVEVLTYAILSNHFHVLVRVPQRTPVSDAELLRRYRLLYPKLTRYQSARLEVIEAQLVHDGPEAQTWRRRQLALMGDISPFMKLLKQRFSIWFNKSHRRFGTLWSERFKSVLVEPGSAALRIMAAYIDLNAVRAGLVTDPKDYRFCGYAEAVAGNESARTGLGMVTGLSPWSEVQAQYRQWLFGTGSERRGNGAVLVSEDFDRVLREGGSLPLATALLSRWRHFSDGAVLGGRAFVATQLSLYSRRTGRRNSASPFLLPALGDWRELAILRPPRHHLAT